MRCNPTTKLTELGNKKKQPNLQSRTQRESVRSHGRTIHPRTALSERIPEQQRHSGTMTWTTRRTYELKQVTCTRKQRLHSTFRRQHQKDGRVDSYMDSRGQYAKVNGADQIHLSSNGGAKMVNTLRGIARILWDLLDEVEQTEFTRTLQTQQEERIRGHAERARFAQTARPTGATRQRHPARNRYCHHTAQHRSE